MVQDEEQHTSADTRSQLPEQLARNPLWRTGSHIGRTIAGGVARALLLSLLTFILSTLLDQMPFWLALPLITCTLTLATFLLIKRFRRPSVTLWKTTLLLMEIILLWSSLVTIVFSILLESRQDSFWVLWRVVGLGLLCLMLVAVVVAHWLDERKKGMQR